MVDRRDGLVMQFLCQRVERRCCTLMVFNGNILGFPFRFIIIVCLATVDIVSASTISASIENVQLVWRIEPGKAIDFRGLLLIGKAIESNHEEAYVLRGAASAWRCAQQDAGRVAVAMVGAQGGRQAKSRPVVGYGGAV